MTHERRGRRVRDVFKVTGEIDMATAPVLFDTLLPAVLFTESDTVLLKLADVTFFDSSGLDVLIDLSEMAGACGKDVLLVEPSESVSRVIDMAGRGRGLRQAVRVGGCTSSVDL